MIVNNYSKFGLLAGLFLVLPALGCPAADDTADDDAADDADDGATGDTGMTGGDDGVTVGDDGVDSSGGDDGMPGSCPGAGGAAAEGDACTANGDCASGVCLLFSDVPTPTDAVCGAEPVDCNTRITGTVQNFEDGTRVTGATVRVAQALQAATNPTGAMAIVEGTSDSEGHFDATSDMPIMAQIGIVALVEGDGFFLTATGVSSPLEDGSYSVGNGIHELWAVPTSALTTWSDGLAMDAAIDAANLPLGEQGGVAGLARNDTTGDPVARASVISNNGDSAAIVRYLADDGSWSTDATGSAGIFVIIAPALAETFHVEVEGATVSGDGTAGSADGAIFTLIMDVAE